jgi:hypothetical protein
MRLMMNHGKGGDFSLSDADAGGFQVSDGFWE